MVAAHEGKDRTERVGAIVGDVATGNGHIVDDLAANRIAEVDQRKGIRVARVVGNQNVVIVHVSVNDAAPQFGVILLAVAETGEKLPRHGLYFRVEGGEVHTRPHGLRQVPLRVAVGGGVVEILKRGGGAATEIAERVAQIVGLWIDLGIDAPRYVGEQAEVFVFLGSGYQIAPAVGEGAGHFQTLCT